MVEHLALSGKALIVSAPSGSGKTTLLGYLRSEFPQLSFSVSASSRSPREGEVDGRDYHFLSLTEFQRRIEADDFLEWEEVYPGVFYGTLCSQVRAMWEQGKVALFDIDVRGALNLKRKFADAALTLFIEPPSIEELRRRLLDRGANTAADIEERISRARCELEHRSQFDAVVVNDDLEVAQREVRRIVSQFLGAR